MSTALTCLPLASQFLPSSRRSRGIPQSSSITTSPNLKWSPIKGPVEETLFPELQTMYWDGVKRELAHILLTLKKWQQPEYASTILVDEKDDFIHGFDTFVDQVSESSHDFASRYHAKTQNWKKGEQIPYKQALMERGKDLEAERKSSTLKIAIRDSLSDRKRYTVVQRRARMLLQSGGFLDIDKLIEYRPPERLITFWKRPVAPQLTLQRFDDSYMPFFKPLKCSRCQHTIRGCMFQNTDQRGIIICESCYRDHHYGDHLYFKMYKHCVLKDSINRQDGQRICRCSTVPHIGSDGSFRELFPVSEGDDHRGSVRKTAIKCGLLNLGTLVAEAKYQGMLSKHEKHINLGDQKRINEARDQKQRDDDAYSAKIHSRSLKTVNEKSLVDPRQRIAEGGNTEAFEEDEADEDVPFFMRKFANRYPFGNVHMALRVGPLIIENGVEHVRGVLITNRDPPNLQVLRDSGRSIEYSLALSGDTERSLHCQYRTDRKPKRYKAVMKQVAGGAFSGLSNELLEEKIINALLHESHRRFDMSPSDEEAMLEQSTDKIVALLKRLIGPRIEVYLQSIASRLLNPSTNLHWNFRTNNCQTFCDSLLDQELFGSLVAPSSLADKGMDPLYLMSFVSRPGSYDKDPVKTKFDVPSGLTEEYLLKFRYGRHDESDVIDTLQEYWHDWGAFGAHIYKHGDVFPWDCTEAFGRYPTVCNDCNISKHVWAFPFDSFSIAALHLTKDRHLYPPTTPNDPHSLNDLEWMRNRVTILLAQDVLLTAAAAMAKTRLFHEATAWLYQQDDPKIDRLKLGGIHRAQPFSHSFEHGKYHHYFIAEWAHLKREQQITAYELLRDGRVRMPDVPGMPSDFHRDDGGGCGGCAGAVGCGGGCGSGCAASCGGAGCGGGCSGGCGGGCGGGGG